MANDQQQVGTATSAATASGGPTTGTSSTATSGDLARARGQVERLTEDIGFNRQRADLTAEDFGDLHKRSHDLEWRMLSAERAKASVVTMLGELGDMGFAWRDLARMVRVSVPAMQKWRRGDKASGDSRQRVASLLAACDLIRKHYMVEEIASWFEVPLVKDVPVTPIDLYSEDRADLVFEFAHGQMDPEVLLTQYDPDWRERYRSNFEVFVGEDGNRSMRLKD
ncbi:MAG: hypothetical protein ACTHNS_05230 [Marmoricola sp.]